VSLPTQILVSLVLGLGAGVFFGDLITPVSIVGDAFIRLLQMSVLPYVAVSLVVGLGSLRADGAARLAPRAGVVQGVLWAAAFAAILVMPLAFPDWETASFFSTSLVAEDTGLDLLSLFIPANPFAALADTVVPAVVVFSAALGVALIGHGEKRGLVRGLETVKDALSAITTFVVRLAPIGIFAISANAAATSSFDQARSLQAYMLSYAFLALVLALWVLPGLVAAVTPYGWRQIVELMRGALITAFATGSVFVVLSILVERTRDLAAGNAEQGEDAAHFVDVVVPVAFTFPSAGKLLSLGFVLFAGWVSGYSLSATQYPTLVVTGLASYFGSTVAAIPFLLDAFQIPADTFQLFLVADNVVGNRFGSMLGAMHLVAMALLASAAMAGGITIRPMAVLRYLAVTAILLLGVTLGTRALFDAMGHEYAGYDRFVSMTMRFPHEPATVHDAPPQPLAAARVPGADPVAAIVERGVLQIGYASDRLPWVFQNAKGELVGFDVEMAHILAEELGVDLALWPVEPGAAWSLIYPQFTVAVPRPDILKVPLAYAVRRGDERMAELLTWWIELKKRDGTIDQLFAHWILGELPPRQSRRWSVWRDVLGFGGKGAR